MRTLQELGQAVRQARESRKLTLAELSAATGISKPYLSNIENATMVGPPSAEKLMRLAEALGLDADKLLQAGDWLRTPQSIRELLARNNSGTPRRADGTVNLDAILKPASQAASGNKAVESIQTTLKLVPVPLINRVPAGKPAEYTDLEYPLGVADRYVAGIAPNPAEGESTGAAIALRVTGDSMEPEYKDGDVVQFADTPARDGDDCLVRLGELENFAQTFKRIYFVTSPDNDQNAPPVAVRLVPLNPKYPVREIRIEEVTGLFPAIWKMTPTRRSPATAAKNV